MTLSFLTPTSLHPEFAMQMSALRLFGRVGVSACAQQVRKGPPAVQLVLPEGTTGRAARRARKEHREGLARYQVQGPLTRMRQLSKDPVFGPMMRQLLSGARLPPDWQHQVRHEWRMQQWARVARDRPQHFAGVERGVDRTATL
eukprot:13958106-Alexandrium_andersonii.AAC.1